MSEVEGRMLKKFTTCLAYPVNLVEGGSCRKKNNLVINDTKKKTFWQLKDPQQLRLRFERDAVSKSPASSKTKSLCCYPNLNVQSLKNPKIYKLS